MTYGKWNDAGELDYTDTIGSNTLFDIDLNKTFQVMIPLGGILCYAKNLSGVPSSTLFNNWLECDGSVISDADSPFNGQTLPDMNSAQRFIRGATSTGNTGGATTHTHTIGGNSGWVSVDNQAVVAMAGPDHSHTITSESNNPKYYTIVWIMRVK